MDPREYARLQGVPDSPLVGTRIQQLWGFADAVCVPAIRWIDQHILSPLYELATRTGRNGHGGGWLAGKEKSASVRRFMKEANRCHFPSLIRCGHAGGERRRSGTDGAR